MNCSIPYRRVLCIGEHLHLHVIVSGCAALLGVSDNAYIPYLIIINMSDGPILAPAFIPDNGLRIL
jgi:hypothetical protein